MVQRVMGRCYAEGLSKQERVEGGANLVREASKTHGPPTLEVWQAVLVRAKPPFKVRANLSRSSTDRQA